MTLTELRYIVALARERHFGRAAEACHVSQPTLSVALKKVEGQIGTVLFERTANDVRITSLGERIVEQAKRVLDEAVKLEEIAEATGDPMSGQLRVDDPTAAQFNRLL
jgi:LysR family hydrogen peroxide-inducible transcriptional activator